ncbi:hypothetical protein [Halostagnicola kamekurae]|uniref:Uncharacterized protein n=1 Tax=Halostagnicola kamekurae TaxID=619731 RepID=A0A1I6UY40_9EURY|nr:hypothetical protein [Halostagnicola kamekurae]SFT06303.1 hypothetical protein SAMN04488556_4164 [Halostagnicola kamekurae]
MEPTIILIALSALGTLATITIAAVTVYDFVTDDGSEDGFDRLGL